MASIANASGSRPILASAPAARRPFSRRRSTSGSRAMSSAPRRQARLQVEALILRLHLTEPIAPRLLAESSTNSGRSVCPYTKRALNSPKHSSEASQFSVTRQTTTRQAPAASRKASRPFLARVDVGMIDEEVGEAFAAQPRLQRDRHRVVPARVTDEQNRHASPLGKHSRCCTTHGPGWPSTRYTHRRTEGDYISDLLDAVRLEDWREVVAATGAAVKDGERHGAQFGWRKTSLANPV